MLTQLNCNNFLKRLVVPTFFGLGGQLSAGELDILTGHYEMQVDYTESNGFEIGVSYTIDGDFLNPESIRRLQPEVSWVIAPPISRTTIAPASSFIGEVGEPLWLLSQGFEFGNHFLGMRMTAGTGTFLQSRNGFFSVREPGNISLQVTNVTGTGPDRGGAFGLWSSAGLAGFNVFFNSNDGLDENDIFPEIEVGAHRHFNWGLTRPGSYQVELVARGRLIDGDRDVEGTEVVTFVVPHDGVVSDLQARVCREGERWEFAVGNPEMGVVYGDRRVFVEASEQDGDGNWTCPLNLSAEGWNLPDNAGLPIALAQNGAGDDFAGGVRLRLTGHVGPGEVRGSDSGGGVLFDSADGFDSSDNVSLGGGGANGTLVFSEPGIHWLEFQAEGLSGDGSVVASSGILQLRCGANVSVDHDYATWADSYERALGLSVGALADPDADTDGDGQSNQFEYLTDASGNDSSRLGGPSGTVLLEEEGTHSRFVILRDLYKQSLDDTGTELVSGASVDGLVWRELNFVDPGFPLEFFETCLLYTSPSPRDQRGSRMPSSA